MKRKDNAFNYGHAQRQQALIEDTVLVIPECPDIQEKISSFDSFVNIVYALDPMTKVPTGDLTYYVSDKANPEVKQWILQNLLQDVSSAANPSFRDISDDDILNLSRRPNESSDDYVNRINDYARMNADLYERLARASVTGLDQQRSVSSESQETSVSSE